MSSNDELRAEAEALGEKLGVAVETVGKHRKTLESMVADLRERVSAMEDRTTDAPGNPDSEEEPEARAAVQPIDGAASDSRGGPPEVKPKPRRQQYPYEVAEGKSITSPRGILGPGEEVRLQDFANDTEAAQEALDSLVASGAVAKK